MAALSPSHRPGCARLGIARLNAFRLNVYEPIAYGYVNGVPVTTGAAGTGLRIEGASIDQILNDQVDTASFRTRGFVPVAGQTIAVYDGEATAEHQLFGGRILETTQIYESRKENRAHEIRCVDPTWLLNRRTVLATYVGQSATAIVLDLIARWARGVTTRAVVAGLPVVDEITFTNEYLPVCLTAICERIGGHWYLDYTGDLHVFLSEAPDANTITDAAPHGAADLALTEDLSQVVTQVIGRGGGVGAAIDLPAGSVDLPVDEGDAADSWYSPSGGLVEVTAQRVTYSGVRGLGATGALVGTGNAPTASPRPTPVGGNTHTVGATYGYAVTFTTASGETLVGPARSILIQSINPATPPAVSARSRGSSAYPPGLISPGANQMRFAVQIQYRAGAWGPLGTGTGWIAWDGNDWEVYIGPRSYYTAPDGSSAYYYPTLEPGGPAAPTYSVSVYRMDNAGVIANQWQFTSGDSFYANGWIYQCACGYTTSSYVFPASGYGAVDLYDVPISKAPGVTGRKIYRTPANGSALKLLTTLANNTADQYGDRSADAALGAAPPTADTSGIKDEGQILPGSTSLLVSSTTPFEADMVGGVAPGGWIRVGGMVLRYTGIAAGALTGIPATGIGSITAVIRYGAQVLVQPRLIGIPASGTGALVRAIRKGDTVTIRLEQLDTAARDLMAQRLATPGVAVDPLDGVIELVISDARFDLVELQDHVDATLLDRKDPQLTLTFTSRDLSLQVGRLITVNTTEPPINGTFRIHKIGLSEIAVSGGRATVHPLKTVEASSQIYKFTDLLRRLRSVEGGVR
jgi:hypothetical protein